MKLSWTDPKYGINEENIKKYNLKDLMFIQGTSIILSFDVAQQLILYKEMIKTDIIDDVSIAVFIRDLLPDAYNNVFNYEAKYCVNDYSEDCIFIRNNLFTTENYSTNRSIDIENMKKIINTYFIINK